MLTVAESPLCWVFASAAPRAGPASLSFYQLGEVGIGGSSLGDFHNVLLYMDGIGSSQGFFSYG
jgi:hypothetical protein